ncbi:MAG: hypothetical protein CMN76_04775 [Spirochaetaceae bacterium]|nr:hypothetical protein [Spirochaetaceae bacterium]|tara:strand:+ start:664 stop:780 length:117 start_codon:yes stop_codon:yes gene_type:complete
MGPEGMERIREDTDRDRWIYAREAVEYGIVDSVMGSDG